MKKSVSQIVSQIVKLSLNHKSEDTVRNIYSVLMDVDGEVGRIMGLINEHNINDKD